MPEVLSDVILSTGRIHGGIKGKVIRRNERVRVTSGKESVNALWDQSLREYEWDSVPLRRQVWMQFEAIHEVTAGGAYGFLLLDPKDHSVSETQGVAATRTSTTFQLYRRLFEPVSERYSDRKITRPKADSFQLYLGGVLQNSGYTLDAATGIVTIASAPDAEDVTWSGVFYTPVHFVNDAIDWSMVVPGMDPDGRFYVGPGVLLQEIRE